ncbi:hypothetical protein FEM48_Zijuj02G0081900 [Ziziphus jujuba var. spinosa]|uniref:Uncharacterized protein n=1 Tax=Ziziphus jujuba var. spinosa TaxID=714518 RepID=A0A978VUL8_ZIZJJ|nr:hypothetical protein FEM48_Zijuj02G0081900 [Ziziphus jujuba var. spinosa]
MSFPNIHGKEKVVQGAPWHFDKALVLLKEVNSTLCRISSLSQALFWVQVQNVLIIGMTKERTSVKEGMKAAPSQKRMTDRSPNFDDHSDNFEDSHETRDLE